MYRVFGIIGDPVSHSLSPVMHNAALRELGIRAVYGAFQVKREHLKEAIEGIKALNISGVSVTIPHKEAVIPLLDYVDEVAQKIGAVNTIVNREGKLWGYNTDWLGVLKALYEKGIEIREKRVVIVGAGGASRAVVYALREGGAKEIILYNRTFEKAKALAEEFSCKALPWEELKKAEGDIIIQATSVGLKSMESPVPSEIFKNFKVAMDIVYLPLKTKFLQDAEKFCKIIDGLRMLLYQGVEQFKLFTGLNPPVNLMEKMLYEEVKKMEKELGFGD
ncbi:MAG: shikimate dehydrogenase [Caldimicrobium sp.]|jgi:shikimate dehydrogenase